MQLITTTIAAALEERHDIPGAVFLLYDIGGAAAVDVTLLRRGSPAFVMPGVKRGIKVVVPKGFTGLKIKNTDAAAHTIRFFILNEGDGEVQFTDNLIIGNDTGNPVPVDVLGAVLSVSDIDVNSPDTLSSPADVAVVSGNRALLIAATVKKKREVVIKNPATNLASFRIGDVTCDATHGFELAPGESITIDTRAAIYAWNTGVADQSASLMANYRN